MSNGSAAPMGIVTDGDPNMGTHVPAPSEKTAEGIVPKEVPI